MRRGGGHHHPPRPRGDRGDLGFDGGPGAEGREGQGGEAEGLHPERDELRRKRAADVEEALSLGGGGGGGRSSIGVLREEERRDRGEPRAESLVGRGASGHGERCPAQAPGAPAGPRGRVRQRPEQGPPHGERARPEARGSPRGEDDPQGGRKHARRRLERRGVVDLVDQEREPADRPRERDGALSAGGGRRVVVLVRGGGAAVRHGRHQRGEQLGPVVRPGPAPDAVARSRRGQGHGQRGGEPRVALAEQGREQARADRGLFLVGELCLFFRFFFWPRVVVGFEWGHREGVGERRRVGRESGLRRVEWPGGVARRERGARLLSLGRREGAKPFLAAIKKQKTRSLSPAAP